jgi:hypothetical protein
MKKKDEAVLISVGKSIRAVKISNFGINSCSFDDYGIVNRFMYNDVYYVLALFPSFITSSDIEYYTDLSQFNYKYFYLQYVEEDQFDNYKKDYKLGSRFVMPNEIITKLVAAQLGDYISSTNVKPKGLDQSGLLKPIYDYLLSESIIEDGLNYIKGTPYFEPNNFIFRFPLKSFSNATISAFVNDYKSYDPNDSNSILAFKNKYLQVLDDTKVDFIKFQKRELTSLSQDLLDFYSKYAAKIDIDEWVIADICFSANIIDTRLKDFLINNNVWLLAYNNLPENEKIKNAVNSKFDTYSNVDFINYRAQLNDFITGYYGWFSEAQNVIEKNNIIECYGLVKHLTAMQLKEIPMSEKIKLLKLFSGEPIRNYGLDSVFIGAGEENLVNKLLKATDNSKIGDINTLLDFFLTTGDYRYDKDSIPDKMTYYQIYFIHMDTDSLNDFVEQLFYLWTLSKYCPNGKNEAEIQTLIALIDNVIGDINASPTILNFEIVEGFYVSTQNIEMDFVGLSSEPKPYFETLIAKDLFTLTLPESGFPAVNSGPSWTFALNKQEFKHHYFQPVCIASYDFNSVYIKAPLKKNNTVPPGAPITMSNAAYFEQLELYYPAFLIHFIIFRREMKSVKNVVGTIAEVASFYFGTQALSNIKYIKEVSQIKSVLTTVTKPANFFLLVDGVLQITWAFTNHVINYLENTNSTIPGWLEKLNNVISALMLASLAKDLVSILRLKKVSKELIEDPNSLDFLLSINNSPLSIEEKLILVELADFATIKTDLLSKIPSKYSNIKSVLTNINSVTELEKLMFIKTLEDLSKGSNVKILEYFNNNTDAFVIWATGARAGETLIDLNVVEKLRIISGEPGNANFIAEIADPDLYRIASNIDDVNSLSLFEAHLNAPTIFPAPTPTLIDKVSQTSSNWFKPIRDGNKFEENTTLRFRDYGSNDSQRLFTFIKSPTGLNLLGFIESEYHLYESLQFIYGYEEVTKIINKKKVIFQQPLFAIPDKAYIKFNDGYVVDIIINEIKLKITTDPTKHQRKLYNANVWEIRTTNPNILESKNGTLKDFDIEKNEKLKFGPNALKKHDYIITYSDGVDLNSVVGFKKWKKNK